MSKRLNRVYMDQSKQLRDRGRTFAAAAFVALPAVDDDHYEEWLESVRPISDGTASANAQLASAFLAYAAGVVIARHIDGLLYTQDQIGVQPFDVRYRDPFIATFNALGQGKPYDEAIAAGASRAGLIVDEDAQWAATTAMRDTATEVEAAGRRVVGYERIPEADACSFCELVAGQRYTTDNLAPLHAGCGCGVEPIFG